MGRKPWDVIVVGAGPSGASLATRLARRHRVLLLDRRPVEHSQEQKPRIGESLPGAAAGLLKRLGVLERFLADGHAERRATLSTWDDATPVWFDPLRDPCGPGWQLQRDVFDNRLLQAARDGGATLVRPCGALHPIRQDGLWEVWAPQLKQRFQSRILVDATGRQAHLARGIGLRQKRTHTLLCLHLLLPKTASTNDCCTRVCAESKGWWYSASLPEGERVLAFHLDPNDSEARTLLRPGALLQKAQRVPLLADVLPSKVKARVHACRADGQVLDPGDVSGFYAIGDASISFDPIASQGLFHALATAEAAGSAISKELAGEDAAKDAYLAEQRAVHARYQLHHQATYAGPARRFREPFWSSRARAQGTQA